MCETCLSLPKCNGTYGSLALEKKNNVSWQKKMCIKRSQVREWIHSKKKTGHISFFKRKIYIFERKSEAVQHPNRLQVFFWFKCLQYLLSTILPNLMTTCFACFLVKQTKVNKTSSSCNVESMFQGELKKLDLISG